MKTAVARLDAMAIAAVSFTTRNHLFARSLLIVPPRAWTFDYYLWDDAKRGVGAAGREASGNAQGGAPVFMYVFTHESESLVPGTDHKVGAAHALEIPYKFNLVPPQDPAGGGGMMAIKSPDDVKAASNMSEMWSTFARSGRPGAKGQPEWPAYTIERRATMEIDAQCRVVDDPNSAERQMWQQLEP